MEMCKVFWIAVLEIILVHSAQIGPVKDIENWRAHQKRIAKFPCGTPQPRSLRLEDIIQNDNLPDLNVEVSPPMTVLHRCDYQAGCCMSGKICAPQVTEEIFLTFWVYSKLNKRHASNGPNGRYIQIAASNHTYCSCQMEHDLPK